MTVSNTKKKAQSLVLTIDFDEKLSNLQLHDVIMGEAEGRCLLVRVQGRDKVIGDIKAHAFVSCDVYILNNNYADVAPIDNMDLLDIVLNNKFNDHMVGSTSITDVAKSPIRDLSYASVGVCVQIHHDNISLI